MTYNFDPERWYDNELAFIKTRRKTGQITADEFEEALRQLDDKYDSMWGRLDGTYNVSEKS